MLSPGRMRLLGPPSVSRDGLWIAVMVDPDDGDAKPEAALAVAPLSGQGTDLEIIRGTRYERSTEPDGLGPVVQPSWSSDGWVFGAWASEGFGGLYAYEPGLPAAQRVPTAALGRPIGHVVAVYAG